MLVQIAKAQEKPVDEVLDQFFEAVSRFGPLVSLELEISHTETRVTAAKAEVERWESQARLTEERCGDREATIDSVQRMLAEGIAEDDMILWEQVLQGAGTTVGELAEHLEQYAALEALTRARRGEAEKLQAQIPPLVAQVQALTEQRENATAAVHAVQGKALNEVAQAGQQAAREITKAGVKAQQMVESLHAAGRDYGDIRAEAAAMAGYVELARALSTQEREVWEGLPHQVVQNALRGVIAWSQEEGRNVQLSPPATLRYRAGISSLTRLSLSELLLWAMAGTFTEEERAALSTST